VNYHTITVTTVVIGNDYTGSCELPHDHGHDSGDRH
jgi:hypothetical protein